MHAPSIAIEVGSTIKALVRGVLYSSTRTYIAGIYILRVITDMPPALAALLDTALEPGCWF